ncbi:MAG: hypothetical protein HWN80_15190 [Candidatus Lokiarchaeota archaeon]|nr:hypothetical protein [Candidatus Lokiarchaeota archaeon]
MPDSNADKLVLELVACNRCKNPFMMPKGENLRKQEKNEEIVCENCIKLEERKRQLTSSVIESQKEIKTSIKNYENKLEMAETQDTKRIFYEKIKKQSEILTKSVELVKKIEETNEEKYIEEYKKLFEKLKNEAS